jgi:hypothetical protein
VEWTVSPWGHPPRRSGYCGDRSVLHGESSLSYWHSRFTSRLSGAGLAQPGAGEQLWSLWIVLDFLLIVPTVALYLVLRRDNHLLALLGALLSLFFIFYDVSVTELNSLTLVSLSNGYASAATALLKAPYVAAATYGYTALPLQTVLSFAIGSLGYLLWSVAMLQGSIFPKWAGILGIVMGVTGVVGAAAPLVSGSIVLGVCQYLAIPLMGLWFLIIGVLLRRYGRRAMNK